MRDFAATKKTVGNNNKNKKNDQREIGEEKEGKRIDQPSQIRSKRAERIQENRGE